MFCSFVLHLLRHGTQIPMRIVAYSCSFEGYIPEDKARNFTQQIVLAMDYMHTMEVVNRCIHCKCKLKACESSLGCSNVSFDNHITTKWKKRVNTQSQRTRWKFWLMFGLFVAHSYVSTGKLQSSRTLLYGLWRCLVWLRDWQGVQCRDLKLENTLLSQDKMLVKLTDFGFAKGPEDSLPKSSVGTPNYAGLIYFLLLHFLDSVLKSCRSATCLAHQCV